MHVLHVVPSVGRQSGGLTSAVVGLAAALQDQKLEVSIHTTDSATPPQAKEARRGLKPFDLPDRFDDLTIAVYPMSQPYRLSYAPQLLAGLHKVASSCDLIHIHGLFLYPQFAAAKVAAASATPYIVSTHGMLHPHFQQRGKARKKITDWIWQRKMLKQASALHATSQVEKAALEALGYGPSIHVIPNGISTAAYVDGPSGMRFRIAHGISSETPLIVSHGRITPVKGLDILVAALPHIHKYHPQAMLIIVGPDDEGLTEILRDQAVKLGVGSSVMFTGSLDGNRLLDAIDAADVWTLLSHSDSFGLAALEAMAAGKAVVASRHVDLASEAIKHDALVMIDTGVSDAANAICELLNDPTSRNMLGTRAKHFSARYDWPSIAAEFISLYDGVLRSTQDLGVASEWVR